MMTGHLTSRHGSRAERGRRGVRRKMKACVTKRNTRSSDSAVKAGAELGRKNRLMRRKLGLEIGDRVRVIEIPTYLKDSDYDLKDAEHREMRTAELFRFCLGREFTIRNFGKYSTVELDAAANREVRREFGKYHTIWLLP